MKLLLRDVRARKRQALITDLNSIARKEIEKVLDKEVKPAMIKSHELVVKDWKHKPDFQARKFLKPDSISINLFPAGPNKEIWIFVDQGTRSHVIVPKRAPYLKFKAGVYVPKTLAKPARTVSGGGVVRNPQWVTTKRVQHPGTEAREFSKTIAEDIKPDFRKVVENAFRRTADKVSE